MYLGLILIGLAFPLLELAVLIKVGQTIGFWWTVLLLAATAVGGGLIVQAQGLSASERAMASMREGRAPLEPVADSFMLMIAGALLLIPGLITDVFAIALLVPPVRRWLARWAIGRMMKNADVRFETHTYRRQDDQSGGRPPGEDPGNRWPRSDGGVVIDGEYERVDEGKPKGREDPRLPRK